MAQKTEDFIARYLAAGIVDLSQPKPPAGRSPRHGGQRETVVRSRKVSGGKDEGAHRKPSLIYTAIVKRVTDLIPGLDGGGFPISTAIHTFSIYVAGFSPAPVQIMKDLNELEVDFRIGALKNWGKGKFILEMTMTDKTVPESSRQEIYLMFQGKELIRRIPLTPGEHVSSTGEHRFPQRVIFYGNGFFKEQVSVVVEDKQTGSLFRSKESRAIKAYSIDGLLPKQEEYVLEKTQEGSLFVGAYEYEATRRVKQSIYLTKTLFRSVQFNGGTDTQTSDGLSKLKGSQIYSHNITYWPGVEDIFLDRWFPQGASQNNFLTVSPDNLSALYFHFEKKSTYRWNTISPPPYNSSEGFHSAEEVIKNRLVFQAPKARTEIPATWVPGKKSLIKRENWHSQSKSIVDGKGKQINQDYTDAKHPVATAPQPNQNDLATFFTSTYMREGFKVVNFRNPNPAAKVVPNRAISVDVFSDHVFRVLADRAMRIYQPLVKNRIGLTDQYSFTPKTERKLVTNPALEPPLYIDVPVYELRDLAGIKKKVFKVIVEQYDHTLKFKGGSYVNVYPFAPKEANTKQSPLPTASKPKPDPMTIGYTSWLFGHYSYCKKPVRYKIKRDPKPKDKSGNLP